MQGTTIVTAVNGFGVEVTCYRNGQILTDPKDLKEKIDMTIKRLESKTARDAAQEILRRLNTIMTYDFDIHQYSVLVNGLGETASAYSWSW